MPKNFIWIKLHCFFLIFFNSIKLRSPNNLFSLLVERYHRWITNFSTKWSPFHLRGRKMASHFLNLIYSDFSCRILIGFLYCVNHKEIEKKHTHIQKNHSKFLWLKLTGQTSKIKNFFTAFGIVCMYVLWINSNFVRFFFNFLLSKFRANNILVFVTAFIIFREWSWKYYLMKKYFSYFSSSLSFSWLFWLVFNGQKKAQITHELDERTSLSFGNKTRGLRHFGMSSREHS